MARLWRGEVSLALTYWVFYCLIGGVVGLVGSALILAVPTIATIAAVGTLALGYQLFTSVAIFRSGGNYRRRMRFAKAWLGGLAQVMAIVGLLGGIGTFIAAIPGHESDAALQAMIDAVNQQVPKTAFNGVRFDGASLEERSIVYNYTLLREERGRFATYKANLVRQKAMTELCENRSFAATLNTFRKAVYRYSDINHDLLFSFDVTTEICSKAGAAT